MNTLTHTARVTALLLVVGSLFAAQALGNPAVGQNADLEDNPNVYIPLSPQYSGTLGDLYNGGPQEIGRIRDNVLLSGIGDMTSGWLDIVLHFDLAPELTLPDITSGALAMVFRDLDFRPVTYTRFIGAETLDMQIHAGGGAVGNELIVDDSNYDDTDFNATLLPSDTPAGTGFDTNNQLVQYEFDLAGDFGLDAGDLALIASEKAFDLHLRLRTIIESTVAGNTRVYNTTEQVEASDFTFVQVPEPTSLALIAIGAIGLVFRKVRRSA
jgi:hypothetical protein